MPRYELRILIRDQIRTPGLSSRISYMCNTFIDLSTLQHLLRRIHHLLNLPTTLLNNLLHRRARLLQLIRPRSLVQLHCAQFLLLLAARIFDRRGSFVASLGRFCNCSFARIGSGGRDVDYEQERVGACGVWLGREREGGCLDGGGNGFDVL